MTHTTAKLLAALALAGVAAGAQASASASANVDFSSFTIQVKDLDDNDGITAALTLTNGYGSANIYTNGTASSSYYFYDYHTLPASSDIGGNINSPHASGSATNGGNLNTAASITQVTPGVWSIQSYASNYWQFSLNGAAAVKFSALASASNNNTDPSSLNSWAYAYLGGEVTFSDDGSKHSFYSNLQANANQSQSGKLSATFASFDGPAQVTLYLASNAGTGANNAPPVPEPSEYLMLLAGLGIVGYAAKRRQA